MGEQLNNELTRRSLWLGDLASWMDEGFLFNLFLNTRQLMSVKLIRNRSSGQSEGYAFLEFSSPEAAANVLALFNGQVIPGTDQIFRLNWAAYGVGKTASAGEDHSLFVGDLAPDVSDLILQEYFRQFYPSVRSAKVITDTNTGRSKGYGFVRFSLESERDRALTDMSGQYLSNRPIRVSLATARKNAGSSGGAQASQVPHPSDFDTTNTTLFIGGLSAGVSEEQLRSQFARFGDIIYVKIPQGKGCGFVQFVLRASAERALAALNGQVMGGSAIRISWGRSSSRATSQSAAQGMGMGGGQGAGGALVGGAALVGGGGPGLAFGMAPPGSLGMAPPGHHAPGASFGPFDPALLAAQGYASFAHAGAAGMGAGPGSSVHEAYAVGGPQGAAFGPGGMRSAHGADLYHAFQPAVGVGAVSRGGSGLDVGDGSGSGRHEGGGANGFGSGPFGSLVPGGSSLAPPQGGPGSEEGGPGSAPAALASAKSAGSVGSRGEAGDGSGGGAQVAGAGDAEADTISAAFGIKGAGSDAGAATPPAASPTGAGAGGPPNGSVSAASSNLIGSHLFANFLA